MNNRFWVYVTIIVAIMCCFALAADGSESSFGKRAGDTGWSAGDDHNADGIVDGYDLAYRTGDDSKRLVTDKNAFRADRILVKFAPRLSMVEKENLVKKVSEKASILKSVANVTYETIAVPNDRTVEQFLKEMLADPSVADAHFDFICRATRTPNDNYFSLQWNFHHVKAPRGWDLTSGGNNDVVVAIIDSGVAYEDFGEYKLAPDLAGTKFVSGYDFFNDDSHANDDEGHGTHVAGTVAQTTDNSIGTAGIAYRCALMPIKVLGDSGTGSSSALSQGIRWAADNGADVINMSLGFPTGSSGGSAVREAIQYAYGKGVILVAAAGNEGNDNGYSGGIEYPAAHPEVVAVGAIRYDKQFTNYSNYGQAITCVAPGGMVNFDQNNDGNSDGILQQTFTNGNPSSFRYVFYQGTSMASPHVAAAAALFVSRQAGGPAAFFQAIQETSEDLGSQGFDQHYGYGLIDIEQLVLRGQGWGAN